MKTYLLFIFMLLNLKLFAQEQETAYYLPGTGEVVTRLLFEDSSALQQKFKYNVGWAGNGFGLTGTQRGAPENISVIKNPKKVDSCGEQVLSFYSSERTASWYEENPSAVGTGVYGSRDGTVQDDFFMYSQVWKAADKPSVMMHVYLPASAVYTSLRMTVQYGFRKTNSWPGIWLYGDKVMLRGPGRRDIPVDNNLPNGGKNRWWTLGMSITPEGDIQYYATPSYVTSFTKEDCIGINSVISRENSEAYYPVTNQRDATIMSSNRNFSSTTPTLFDGLYYTKNTEDANNVKYYAPGTGKTVKKLSFEDSSALQQKFNYNVGWAGSGFGLAGTQRGAPENISVIRNPKKVDSSGEQVLSFSSTDRTTSWYAENPSAARTSVYGGRDRTDQDDFFMYSEGWKAADKPSFMMHVYVPFSSTYTTLGLTASYKNNYSMVRYTYPFISVKTNHIKLRGPGRRDIIIYNNLPNGGKNRWWTLGMSITPEGDIQYYATPFYVTSFTKKDCVAINSVISKENNQAYYPIEKQRDAVIISLNRNLNPATPTLFDGLHYTKNTELISNNVVSQRTSFYPNLLMNERTSVDDTFSAIDVDYLDVEGLVGKDENLINVYPNPTSNYLNIRGVKNETKYRVFDDLGREVKKGLIESNKINVNSLSKGVYFLMLEDENKKHSFIKE